jgi:hypothetical protein
MLTSSSLVDDSWQMNSTEQEVNVNDDPYVKLIDISTLNNGNVSL